MTSGTTKKTSQPQQPRSSEQEVAGAARGVLASGATGVAPSATGSVLMARPRAPRRRSRPGPASSRNVWSGFQCRSTCVADRNCVRAPVFCSKTISSWPHGIRTRYCVLTPMKLTSVTVPPAQDVGRRRRTPRSLGQEHLLRADADPHVAGVPSASGHGAHGHPRPPRRRGRGRRLTPETLAPDEVGLPQEVGDEGGARVLVELVGRPHLLDHPGVHDRDRVGHRHGLLLVVRDVHERDAHLGLDALELDLHLAAQLEVEGARAARRAAAPAAG